MYGDRSAKAALAGGQTDIVVSADRQVRDKSAAEQKNGNSFTVNRAAKRSGIRIIRALDVQACMTDRLVPEKKAGLNPEITFLINDAASSGIRGWQCRTGLGAISAFEQAQPL